MQRCVGGGSGNENMTNDMEGCVHRSYAADIDVHNDHVTHTCALQNNCARIAVDSAGPRIQFQTFSTSRATVTESRGSRLHSRLYMGSTAEANIRMLCMQHGHASIDMWL